MAKTLRVAAGQMPGLLNDTAANMDLAAELSVQAAEQGARLILLPEAVLTGLPLRDRTRQSYLDTCPEEFESLVTVAVEHDITICAGFVTPVGEKANIVHVIACPDGQVLFQHKALAVPGEPEWLMSWPDPERVVFVVDGVRVVAAICSELYCQPVLDAIKDSHAQILLHPSAGPMTPEEVMPNPPTPEEAEALAAEMIVHVNNAVRAAMEQGIPRLASNPLGFDGEVYWPGNSYAVDACGNICLHMAGIKTPSLMIPSVGVADVPV